MTEMYAASYAHRKACVTAVCGFASQWEPSPSVHSRLPVAALIPELSECSTFGDPVRLHVSSVAP